MWKIALSTLCISAHAADWDQWRGPDRDGVTKTVNLPDKLPDELTKVWRLEAGSGHSSPLIYQGDIILFSRIGEQEVLRRYKASDGKVIYETGYDAPYEMHPAAFGHGKGPKATPLITDGKVITLGIEGVVSAFDVDTGKLIWQKNHASEFTKNSPLYGASMSPVRWGDGVIVHVGGHGKGAMLKLKLSDGSEQWRWDGDGPGYASPMIYTIDGKEQLITQSQDHVVGLDKAGKLLWSIELKTAYTQNIITPIQVKGRILYTGIGAGMFALEPGSAAPKVAWNNPDVFSYMSTPVVSGDRVYLHSPQRKGQYVSMDASGKVIWSSEGRDGESAALTVVGKRVLSINTEGELIIFPTGTSDYQVEKKYEVANTQVWAHPAFFDDGRMLVKDINHLTLWKF